MAEIFVGRQPILIRRQKTIGYELLYRSASSRLSASIPDGNAPTSQVFTNTMFEMGLDNIVGEHLAFINFTRDFLVKEDLIHLFTGIQKEVYRRGQIVLEVLEDIEQDEELFNRLQIFQHN